MISVLGGTINTFIDSAFVSQRLGSHGLASVNMSMPVYLVLCTVGVLISRGTSIPAAQASGSGIADSARRYYHAGIALSFSAGAVITAAGVVISRPLALLLSQGGILTDEIYDYIVVTFIGSIPAIFLYIPVAYLQLDGKTKAISIMMLIMVAADCLLDWLFMFVFDFGISGAAWASVASTLLACVFGFAATERGFSNFHFSVKSLNFTDFVGIIKYGTPGAMGNFVDAVRMLILNALVLSAYGSIGVAVWAILNTFSEIFIAVTSGIPLAAAPMIGVYFKSRENSGIRILMALQHRIGLVLTIAFGIVLVLANDFWELLFASPQDLLFPLICLALFIAFDLIASIWMVFYNSTGRNALSTLIVLLRKLAMPLLAAFVLVFANGYLWLFLPAGGVLTLAAGAASIKITRSLSEKKSRYPLSGFLMLDDHLEKENKVLDFSILPNMDAACEASEKIQEFCSENDMSVKQTNQLGLAIEELLGIIIQKNTEIKSVDMRAYALDFITGVQLRCAGRKYNPFDEPDTDDDMLLGIMMLRNMADGVNYTYTLGMNTISITFDR